MTNEEKIKISEEINVVQTEGIDPDGRLPMTVGEIQDSLHCFYDPY